MAPLLCCHVRRLRRALVWPALALAVSFSGGPVHAGAASALASGLQRPAGCEQRAPAQPLSLPDAVALALCQHPRTQQSWAQWQARTAELQLQRAEAGPTGTASLGMGHTRQWLRDNAGRSTQSANVGHAALELSWVLMDFGQHRAGEQSAQWAAVVAAASHDDTVLDVAQTTAQAFFALVEAEATLRVLVQEARFTDDLQAQHSRRRAAENAPSAPPAAQTRIAASQAVAKPGRNSAKARRSSPPPAPAELPEPPEPSSMESVLNTVLERLQLRADQSRATLERQLAQGNLNEARGNLATQLGLPLQQALQVVSDDSTPDTVAEMGAVEALLDEVQREHPALRTARARLGVAEADLDVARRSTAPRLTLQHGQRLSRDADRSRSRDASLGLVLEVPLFAGSLRREREAVARAQLDAARAELRSSEREVALQTWSAYQAMQTHAQALRDAQAHEADAQALLLGQLASYRTDHSDLSDVLHAHTTLSEAILSRVTSLSAWRQARMRLAAALGRLHMAPATASSRLR
jgi:outer membrane protein